MILRKARNNINMANRSLFSLLKLSTPRLSKHYISFFYSEVRIQNKVLFVFCLSFYFVTLQNQFIEDMIKIKTREEIELMRESALVVSKTLGMLASEVKPGVTTLYLDKLAEEFIR